MTFQFTQSIMMNPFRYFTLPCVIFLSLLALTACQQQQSRLYQQTSPYNFEETLLYLDVAISEHNYRIIHRSNIGQAIRDRGEKDFQLSTITSFCNITYAHEMLLINPDLINDMPCDIAVREQGDQVIVSTMLMNTDIDNAKQRAFAEKINQNLKSIIRATVE